MDKPQIAFMFGAGAEMSESDFNIKNGYEYLVSTLYAGNEETNYTKSLKGFFRDKYYSDSYEYSGNLIDAKTFMLKNFVLNKSLCDKPFLNKHREGVCKILSAEELKLINDTFNCNCEHIKNDTNYVNKLKSEFKKILTKEKKKKKSNKRSPASWFI